MTIGACADAGLKPVATAAASALEPLRISRRFMSALLGIFHGDTTGRRSGSAIPVGYTDAVGAWPGCGAARVATSRPKFKRAALHCNRGSPARAQLDLFGLEAVARF